jgi:hypothetical protein
VNTDALVTLVSVPVTVLAASDTPQPAYSVPQNSFRALRAVGLADGLVERVDQRHAADLEAVVEQRRLAEDAGDDRLLILDGRRPGRREDVAARAVEQAAADGRAGDSRRRRQCPSMSIDAGENPAVAD